MPSVCRSPQTVRLVSADTASTLGVLSQETSIAVMRYAAPGARIIASVAMTLGAPRALAATDTVSTFSGASLSLLWTLPFAGLLLSLALWPIFDPDFWHHYYGKISAAWALALLTPFAAVFGFGETVHQVVHAVLGEYLPFVILLFALYTISGGIAVRGTLVGTPKLNTSLLAVGAMLASAMGTTGAAMLLIRPLLKANEARTQRVHIVVFFIVLVGNIGGALTPLGDPPLFIGFLNGVDFFWTMRSLALPTLLVSAALLAIFYLVDSRLWRREALPPPAVYEPLAIDGSVNFTLIAGVVAAVLLSGVWKPGISFDIAGTALELQNSVREIVLVVLAILSLALTPRVVRANNAFTWEPIAEVAKLFAGIFITIIPSIAMLQAGSAGALARVVELVTDSASGEPRHVMYFWISGLLSAFLDNAPTYLVFFNLAGGDPVALMGPLRRTLVAISAGAVYFGALTYVGNAPNFMIKAIAEQRGVRMPGFFAYLGYASVLLLPLFVIISIVYG
jgi:Na+/H+ antiporter NhaD/arsenite permease-like protein